jgi:hypothetical protein
LNLLGELLDLREVKLVFNGHFNPIFNDEHMLWLRYIHVDVHLRGDCLPVLLDLLHKCPLEQPVLFLKELVDLRLLDLLLFLALGLIRVDVLGEFLLHFHDEVEVLDAHSLEPVLLVDVLMKVAVPRSKLFDSSSRMLVNLSLR